MIISLQGYPIELLPDTVAGVPSMHICLDFAPELLSQPSLEKQVGRASQLLITSYFAFSPILLNSLTHSEEQKEAIKGITGFQGNNSKID